MATECLSTCMNTETTKTYSNWEVIQCSAVSNIYWGALNSGYITLRAYNTIPANRFGHIGAPTLEQYFPSFEPVETDVIYFTRNIKLHVCKSIGRALVWFCSSLVSRLSDDSYEIRFVKWHPQNSAINLSPKLFDRRTDKRSAILKLETRQWQSRQFGRVRESLEIQEPNKYNTIN